MSMYCLALILGLFASLVSGVKRESDPPPFDFGEDRIDQRIDGPSCGPFNRLCIDGATCVLGVCVCPLNQPNGYIDCVPLGWFQCSVIGDPHIDAFKDSKAMLNFPCRYKLAEFQTPVFLTVATFCTTKVYGTNSWRNGRYYADEVEVEIEVDRPFSRARDLIFRANRDGVEIDFDGTESSIAWGESFRAGRYGLTVEVSFDTTQNYVVISADRCYVRVLLRPSDEDNVAQARAPGIAVSSRELLGLSFPSPGGEYPDSLCGTTDDDGSIYSGRVSVLGLQDENAVLVYDWLNNPIPQGTGGSAVTCSAAQTEFSTCGARKFGAVDLCEPILNNRALNSCLNTNSVDVMDAFKDCLIGYCSEDATSCSASVSALTPCNSEGPSEVHDQNCASY